MSKLGDRLKELSDKHGYGKPAPDAYSAVAEAFANEVRHDAIPWAHKALDEVGAPKGPDIARRIRELVNVSSRRSLELHARIEELERQRGQAVKDVEYAHVALNDARVYGRADMPLSDRVKMLAARCNMLEATANNYAKRVREELRAIIVEAIKGRGEDK